MLQFSIDVEVFRSLFTGSPLMSPPKALIVLHHVRIDLLGNMLTMSLTDLVSYHTSSTTDVQFDTDGSFLLPIASLRRLPAKGNITVTFDNAKVGITDHVITAWSYNTLSVDDYPHIPVPHPDTTSVLEIPYLKWALTEAGHICDPVCITNSLRQISVAGETMEVTDGELFVRYNIPKSPVDFTVPARSLKSFLGALDTDDIEIGNDSLLTSLVSSKRVVSFSNYDYPFPNLATRFNLATVSNLSEIQVSPTDLINAIRGVMVDVSSPLEISGESLNLETVSLHCSDLPTGYSGESQFHCSTTAGKFTLVVNSGKLIRMLSASISEPTVTLMIGDSSISYKNRVAQAVLLRRS